MTSTYKILVGKLEGDFGVNGRILLKFILEK
jgi:hypothetical protein